MGHRYGAIAFLAAALMVTRLDGLVTVQPETMWRVAPGAQGTPTVNEDAAYFLTRAHELVAVRRDVGSVQWRAALDGDEVHEGGGRIRAVGGLVVTGGQTVSAFDARSGRRRWRVDTEVYYGLGFYLGDAYRHLLVAGSANGGLVAIRAATGRAEWKVAVGGPRTTVYAPIADTHGVVAAYRDFGSSGSAGLIAVDLESGRVQWRHRLPAGNGSGRSAGISGGPVFAEDAVIVSGSHGALWAYERLSGALLWSRDAPRVDAPSGDIRPLVVAGAVVAVASLTGLVTGIDVRTGREMWAQRPEAASVAFALAASADTFYVPYASGVVVALSRSTGTERWRIGGPSDGFRWAPAVAGPDILLAGASAGLVSVRERLPSGKG